MSLQTQAIVLNGIPLVIVALLYLGAAAALAPLAWKERKRATLIELAFMSLFPIVGTVAALSGAVVLAAQKPFGGHVWVGLAATAIAAVAPIAVFVRWRDRQHLVAGWREVEERVSFLDRELDSVALVSNELVRADDAKAVARALLEQALSLLKAEFASVALVDEERGSASGLLALSQGGELDWWRDVRLDLDEPSGIAKTVEQREPLVVVDAETSPVVSKELVQAARAKSLVFVPMLADRRVTGVLVVASTGSQREFSGDELTLLQAIAAEGALAFDRVRSATELAEAVERERLVARIGRKVRSELDLDAVLEVAVSETGRALDVARCFVRLGKPGEPMPVEAEWRVEGVESIGDRVDLLTVSDLAVERGQTVAVADVSRRHEGLLALGTRAVLATPIVVFDRSIGVFALHRPEPWAWSSDEIKLAEAVAREMGLAVHTARLLKENEQRLGSLSGLLGAAKAVAGELRIEAVLERLVVESATLLEAEAADCYLYDAKRRTLRCAAVYGLDSDLLGFEAPDDRGLAGLALRRGHSVRSHEYEDLPEAFPHPAYSGFSAALVAPMIEGGEPRGVLGVGTRDPSRRFEQAERETLETFASLAALALRNAASFEERERRARVERGFYRVASILGRPVSLAETIDALAQAACEALGGDFASVLTPSPEGLRLRGGYELPDELAGVPIAPVLEESACEDWVVAAPSLFEDTRFAEEWRRAAKGRYASLLAIPVEAEPAERGLAVVFFAEQRTFSDEDLELARNLADAAKGALERSGLFERERGARALSQQLARIGTFLATELDPDRVLSEVVQQAPALLGADACAIRVVEGAELVVRAAGHERAIGFRSSVSSGLAGDVAQSGAPVAVAHVGQPAEIESDPLLSAGYRSYLGVPLSGPEGGMLGVLSVYAGDGRTWRGDEIEALQALAGNTSAALSNAELYQRIALEKERSDAILAHVADGIVAVDRDERVVLWNAAAEQITGVPRSEAMGREPADVLRRSLGTPEGEHGRGSRIVAIPRGGEEVWLSVSEAVMRDPAGDVAGRIYAFRDISAERLVEQMKSDFVATVSHQLRAPLTSIYGFAETLLRNDVLFGEDERRTFLGYVASESERLTAIVDTLLNVARLEAGDLEVELAPTDVPALVAEVVESVQSSANGHEFVLDVPREPLAAEADEERLRQVLANLIDNAVKYSPQGGKITISARRVTENGTVEVAVVDEGMGIPQAEQQLIFSKFYRRAEVARQNTMGAGLGLFIAHGLLAAMGGSIRVSSVEGQGSSFAFELPLASERTAKGQQVSA